MSCQDVFNEGREVVENLKEISLKDVYWTVQVWEEIGQKMLSLSWRRLLRDGDKLMINWEEETMEEDGNNVVAF